jgi:hypothetical protein
VINCTINGNRQRDERYESTFPFVRGQEFTLEIIAGHNDVIVCLLIFFFCKKSYIYLILLGGC